MLYQSTQAQPELPRPAPGLPLWTAESLTFSALTVTFVQSLQGLLAGNCTPGRQDVAYVVISSHLSRHSFLYTITLPGPKNTEMNVMC